MSRTCLWSSVVVFALLGPSCAWSHHSAAVSYDLDREVIHENVPVVEWRFANPHAQLIFEAPNAAGVPTHWSASTSSVQRLRRNGYTPDTFQSGQIVTVRGAPGRDNQPIMELDEVILADGSVVNFSEPAATTAASYGASTIKPADSPFTGIWSFVRGPVSDELKALAPEDAYFLTVFGQGTELARGERGDVPLTEKGEAFQSSWEPSEYECVPPSGWMAFTAPYLIEFEEPRNGRLRIIYEYMDLERTVWLDGRSFPSVERVPRTLTGYSIGHWEGGTLVVETRHMHANLITRNGIYHTENAVIKERISRDGDSLIIVRVLEDPDHFPRPIASVLQKHPAAETEIVPFGDCVPQG